MAGRLLRIKEWGQMAREADFQPTKLAMLCLVSDRQLQRFSLQRFGLTPGRWLRTLQCQLAKDLISQGWSTKAVAAELKFASESHFCHAFKKLSGRTPQSFAPVYAKSQKLSLLDNNVANEQ